ncbi:MAG: MliC family protein [Alcanivorax sp.]|nr:MliC family protein [Alcanivorax sp.]
MHDTMHDMSTHRFFCCRRSFGIPVLLTAVLVVIGGCDDSNARTPAVAPTSAPPPSQPAADQLSAFAVEQLTGYSPALIRYHCADDMVVTVEYSGPGAILTLGDERHLLHRDPAGSGVRYSNNDVSWHTKEEEGLLSAGEDSRICLQMAL